MLIPVKAKECSTNSLPIFYQALIFMNENKMNSKIRVVQNLYVGFSVGLLCF